MKELNIYTGLLLMTGIYALLDSIINLNIEQWILYLIIVGLIILLDLFPIKLPSGMEYVAGSIGSLLILFGFNLSACVLSFVISMLFAYFKRYKSLRKINWFRYFVTLGMYFICSFLSRYVIGITANLNSFVQVFLTVSVFETTNILLIAGINKTVMGVPDFQNIVPKIKVLIVPVLVSTFVIPHFFGLRDLQEWIKEISFTAVFSVIIIYFSTQFTKEIINRKQIEEVLRIAQQDLTNTIRLQQGMTFKYTEVNGKFIHTMNDGELVYKLGLVPEKVVGRKLSDFLPAEDAARKEEYYRRAWQGEENVMYEGELNGCSYLATLRPIWQNGKVVEVIASCVDITERKKTEELLRKSDKLAVAGQLAAGIAHEIRNPLTSIRGFVQLLQKNVKEEYRQIMLTEIDRMDSIIRDFLILAKPQTTAFKLTNLTLLLDQTILLLNTQAILRNVQIFHNDCTQIPVIMCDENQLKQVFINILKNAIEAMPNGGHIRIESYIQAPDTVLIRFIDDGNGIPEERLEKLGEPFYSTKEIGTGLGLMVSYKIIAEHKGRIRVESEVDKGTKVEIVLPLPALINDEMMV